MDNQNDSVLYGDLDDADDVIEVRAVLPDGSFVYEELWGGPESITIRGRQPYVRLDEDMADIIAGMGEDLHATWGCYWCRAWVMYFPTWVHRDLEGPYLVIDYIM